jgi:hypothetical protein
VSSLSAVIASNYTAAGLAPQPANRFLEFLEKTDPIFSDP